MQPYTILRDGEQVWPGWLRLMEEMPDRFLVGTDAACHSIAGDAEKVRSVQNLLRQLSPEVREKIARGNLRAQPGSAHPRRFKREGA